MSVNLWEDSDSDDNLPAEWEQTNQDNFITYYNRLTGLSQRPHPISGNIKQLPNVLPKGWSSCSDRSGRTIYLNLETGCSTYSDPRLAAARLIHTAKSIRSTQLKFDKFSSVNDILLNKDLRGFYVVVTNSGCGLGLSIAVHLVQCGATVICACTKCPKNAIPVFDKTKAYYEGNIIVDLTLKSNNKESGRLYWIPYNPLELRSIIQSVHSLNWPVHACIITDDLLPPFSGWNFFQSFKRIVSCLRAMIPPKVSSWFKSIFKFVTNYEIQVFNWFGKKIFPAWIPAYSCECSFKHFPCLTSDGFEVSMQCNYLAPALFLERLLKARFVDSSPSLLTTSPEKTFDSSTMRVVIVSSEIHKESNLQHCIKKLDIPKMFQTIPTLLHDTMRQYANSKLCMLLFIREYHQLIRHFSETSTNLSTIPTIFTCTGCDPFSVYCSKKFLVNLYYWSIKNPLLLILQIVYLLSRPFGMSLNQVIANPVLCAVHKVTTLQQSITGHPNQIPYFDKCRPSTTLLDDLPVFELDFLSKTIFTDTMNIFCKFE
ncbi:unnamed protein product [Schistosoma rodhaini]|uniref:WW domain-containing protein n=1 Tax=Schistosoma rodhaini TaxID=6188 RepID=A0AA85FPJ7_9TREM|nr:unnamed protein product [Schistosoma rodhaini]